MDKSLENVGNKEEEMSKRYLSSLVKTEIFSPMLPPGKKRWVKSSRMQHNRYNPLVSDSHSDSLKGAAPQTCIGRLNKDYQCLTRKAMPTQRSFGTAKSGLVACLKEQTTNKILKADRPSSTLADQWQREVDGFL